MRISNMKRLALVALAAGTALATPAGATVTLAYSINGGAVSVITTDAGTPGRASTTSFAIAGGYIVDLSGTAAPFITSPNLLTQTLSVKSSGGQAATLNLFVTDSDLASFNGNLQSVFTSNTLSATSATITSYASAANALYTGSQLQTSAFSGPGVFIGNNVVNAASPWSTTVRYDIAFGENGGFFNGTANLNASAIPEPTTWAMMLLGFGAIGFGLRSRRSAKPKVSVSFA